MCEEDYKILEDQKDIVYADAEDMKVKLLDKMNQAHTEKIYDIYSTGKYTVLKCKTCKNFQAWFNDVRDENENAKDIKYFRTINKNHLGEKH